MSRQWRIFVLEDDEALHRHIINALRKDGYLVHGATNKREAVRMLWAEEHDAVVCDLKTSASDDIELLQWLRAYRPRARVIFVGVANEETRAFVLESGAASYMERPLDLYRLKEELHRLLTQTGFSASLDSFDILDVIQIISTSRKNIALLVSTGLEERGMLCFQEGNMVWAEYGTLRGEEAFFALAAHKNGTVIHQPWNQRVIPNVTQPLSRLILQALTYRAKYARQASGEQEAIRSEAVGSGARTAEQSGAYEVDDTPFLVALEEMPVSGVKQEVESQQETSQEIRQRVAANAEVPHGVHEMTFQANMSEPQEQDGLSREWWQQTGKMITQSATPPSVQESSVTGSSENVSPSPSRSSRISIPITPVFERPLSDSSGMRRVPPGMRKTHMRSNDSNGSNGSSGGHIQRGSSGQNGEDRENVSHSTASDALPSWLTDQPTAAQLSVTPQIPSTPVIQSESSSHSNSMKQPPVSSTPEIASSVWQPVSEVTMTKEEMDTPTKTHPDQQQSPPRLSSSEWQGAAVPPTSGPLQRITASRLATTTATSVGEREHAWVDGSGVYETSENRSANGASGKQRAVKRSYNYASLVSSLQTLGHSITGFVAAAVVTLDGQPIVQVAVDDLDISGLCQSLSQLIRTTLQVLEQGHLSEYEDMVITSGERYIVLRVIRDRSGNNPEHATEPEAFQVLITKRNADTTECIGTMANVEGAIATALNSPVGA